MRARTLSVAVAVIGAAFLVPSASAAPSNDNFADAETIAPPLPFTTTLDTTGATAEPDEPDCLGSGDPGLPWSLLTPRSTRVADSTVWYRFTPDVDGNVRFSTKGSDFDTVLAVYTGESFGDLEEVGCNDDTHGLTSRVDLHLAAGVTYQIQVGGWFGAEGQLALTVEPTPDLGLLSGVATDDETGEPVADICVVAYSDDGYYGSEALTDNSGSWSLPVDPDTYRIEFADCSWDRSPAYVTEFWDDRQSWDDADLVTVGSGEARTGIDAGLSRGVIWVRSPDLAVTDLQVTHDPLRIDGPATGLGTGMRRLIRVEAANLDSDMWGYGTIHVSVCTDAKGIGSCRLIGGESVEMAPGESLDRTFVWDATGSLGDMMIVADLDTCSDPDWSNNQATVRDYSVIGGAGVAVDAGLWGSTYVEPCYGGVAAAAEGG